MSGTSGGFDDDGDERKDRTTPWLEWVAAGIGLVLTLGIFGFIGWQALTDGGVPPVLRVEAETIMPVEGGYRVAFRARNTAGQAAAQVEIEGVLSAGDGTIETARVVLDYIPGHSARDGGLFLRRDPRTGTLGLRASGFASP